MTENRVVSPPSEAAIDRLAAELRPSRKLAYKQTPSGELTLHMFEPVGWQQSDRRACFVAIHGGGWTGGAPKRFYPFAAHFAQLGMVGVSLQYRLMQNGLTPWDCVKDGRSAVRYLRAHAAELGIDPEKIIVTGGSAGGHVAAGTALFDGIDAADDDLQISPTPAALALYYPVIDTSPEGYGNGKCGANWQEISPLHRVKPGLPPMIVFHGTTDSVCPFQGAQRFQAATQQAGNRCELVVHPGGRHGYFLYEFDLFAAAMAKTAAFLTALQLL